MWEKRSLRKNSDYKDEKGQSSLKRTMKIIMNQRKYRPKRRPGKGSKRKLAKMKNKRRHLSLKKSNEKKLMILDFSN